MTIPEFGSASHEISETECREWVQSLLTGMEFPLRRVLIVPPDITRYHSNAGAITVMLYEELKSVAEVCILPATGTHSAMKPEEREKMFPGIPESQFLKHDWKKGVVPAGTISAQTTKEIFPKVPIGSIRVLLNKQFVEEPWDHVFSIGQVVPHEVAGFASYTKNLAVGLGGEDIIHKTHFLSAVAGIENIMGEANNPVRNLLHHMEENLLPKWPRTYIMLVRARTEDGRYVTRGLFAGQDRKAFEAAAALSAQVNITVLDKPIEKAVVYLNPAEYRSTWLGNKAIYRLRGAMARGGELLILGPNLRLFGEDPKIDRLIRTFGYRGTTRILKQCKYNVDLANNLSAAAHLIHGSSDGKFQIALCPGVLMRRETESVGYKYAYIAENMRRYLPETRKTGWNIDPEGNEFFFVQNPAEGLWKAPPSTDPPALIDMPRIAPDDQPDPEEEIMEEHQI